MEDSEHILTMCPRHERLRSEILWNEARETDYKKILTRTPLVKKQYSSSSKRASWDSSDLYRRLIRSELLSLGLHSFKY
jgi:hypothetical protein